MRVLLVSSSLLTLKLGNNPTPSNFLFVFHSAALLIFLATPESRTMTSYLKHDDAAAVTTCWCLRFCNLLRFIGAFTFTLTASNKRYPSYGFNHCIKHLKSFISIFDNRIFVHMHHQYPSLVCPYQYVPSILYQQLKDYTFKFTQYISPNFLFFSAISCGNLLQEFFCDLILANLFYFFFIII